MFKYLILSASLAAMGFVAHASHSHDVALRGAGAAGFDIGSVLLMACAGFLAFSLLLTIVAVARGVRLGRSVGDALARSLGGLPQAWGADDPAFPR